MFTNEQRAEISAAVKKPPERIILRKLQVVQRKMEGESDSEIAEHTSYNETYVRLITATYKSQGLESLCDKRNGGNHRVFTPSREAELFEEAKKEAQTGKYTRILELKASVELKAGRSIDQSTFYRMVARQGGRKIKPRGQNPKKASPEAIEASKKLTLKSKKQG